MLKHFFETFGDGEGLVANFQSSAVMDVAPKYTTPLHKLGHFLEMSV
jgi:hypothetical protein